MVPYETAGASPAAAEVQYHGQRTGVSLNTAVTSVGIVPVANATYARGSTVSLWITGAGQTSPPGVTGQVAGNPGPQPVAAIQVTVAPPPPRYSRLPPTRERSVPRGSHFAFRRISVLVRPPSPSRWARHPSRSWPG